MEGKEVVEMEGRKETKEGGRKKGEGTSGEGKNKHIIVSITSTSDYPYSPTVPSSVIFAAVNFVAIRCSAESFAVSHTLTLVPIKIGTSGTLLWTNAITCVGILDER